MNYSESDSTGRFSEDDLLLLSGLQHLAFCERQWALIHLEGMWAENALTTQGKHLHERTHSDEVEVRGDTRIVRGLRIQSLACGLVGQADVVEFHRISPGAAKEDAGGVTLPGVSGRWQPFPVEYKRGRPKAGRCDEVQVCAQALCLEEMLGCPVPEGALYYGKTHRRVSVAIDEGLREETKALAGRIHALMRAGETPPPVYTKACENCSLLASCMPRSVGKSDQSRRYVSRMVKQALEQGEQE